MLAKMLVHLVKMSVILSSSNTFNFPSPPYFQPRSASDFSLVTSRHHRSIHLNDIFFTSTTHNATNQHHTPFSPPAQPPLYPSACLLSIPTTHPTTISNIRSSNVSPTKPGSPTTLPRSLTQHKNLAKDSSNLPSALRCRLSLNLQLPEIHVFNSRCNLVCTSNISEM